MLHLSTLLLSTSGRSVRCASLPHCASCRVLLLLSLLILGGCGGGSHTSKKTGTGRVAFIVHWPMLTKSTRLIPAASSLVRIQISQGMNGGAPVYGSQDALRPYPPAGASNTLTPPATTVTFNNLPPGQFWATMTAYPNTDGSGVAQASASTPLTIAVGQTSTTNLTMATTITEISLATNRSVVPRGQTRTLTLTAVDANNNTVLTAPAQVQWATDNGGVATVSPTGNTVTVTGVQRGVTTLHVTETESGKTTQTSVVVPGLALSAWPKFRQNELNQAQGVGQGAVGGPKWKSGLNGSNVTSSPALGVDGTVYVGVDNGKFCAFNGSTGVQNWAVVLDSTSYIAASPALSAEGVIYIGAGNGNFYALDSATGQQKWASPFHTGSQIVSTANIASDGTLYVGSADKNVYALTDNGTSVTLKWAFPTSGTIGSSPAIGVDGTVYIGSDDGFVYALTDNGTTVSLKWKSPNIGPVGTFSPALGADGTVYIGSSGHIYALVGATGTIKWQYPSTITGGNFSSSPAIGANGVVYVGSLDGNELALNGASGALIWQYPITGTIGAVNSSAALGADLTVYFGSYDGKVYAVDGLSGTLKWRFNIGNVIQSSPAIGADGSIYISANDQRVYAIY